MLSNNRVLHGVDKCYSGGRFLQVVVVVVFSHELIRYESSRGHKIDGTKPNQTGNRR